MIIYIFGEVVLFQYDVLNFVPYLFNIELFFMEIYVYVNSLLNHLKKWHKNFVSFVFIIYKKETVRIKL
jgi:hypothetical protein